MAEKLTGRQSSELRALANFPGLWKACGPGRRDAYLEFYVSAGFVRWLGEGRGYEITNAGRAALALSKKDETNG